MLRRCWFLNKKKIFFFKITTSTRLRSLRTCRKEYDLQHFLEVWAVDASPCKQACIWSAKGLQAGAVCWRGNRFTKQLRANTHLSLPRSLFFEPEPRAKRYTTTTNIKNTDRALAWRCVGWQCTRSHCLYWNVLEAVVVALRIYRVGN